MAYGGFKDLARRTASDRILRDIKHLILLKMQNIMDLKEVSLQWFINFLIKRLQAEQLKKKNISNKELAKELHK